MMSVLQRARDSGRCPPSMLTDDKMDPDGFEGDVAKLLDTTGFGLAAEPGVVETFGVALKKATTLDSVPDLSQRKAILGQRRCLLLAIVGATHPSSTTLERIISNDYLTTVKTWLDEALSGRVGGIDLLLHMLSNIVDLPVNKSVVKNSGMGKAVGAIEKHSICKGTPNEAAIQERVTKIKDAWQRSVKARKSQESGSPPLTAGVKRDTSSLSATPTAGVKREASFFSSNTTIPKRPKVGMAEETKKVEESKKFEESKKSSFLTLMKKVSSARNGATKASSLEMASRIAKANASSQQSANDVISSKKKSSNRVKWADHFGGELEVSRVLEGEQAAAISEPVLTNSVSWTDRKRRDRARERELLASVKKAKLLDDEDEEPQLLLPPPVGMKVTVQWETPALLPERSDSTKPDLKSTEIEAQKERARVVPPSLYSTDSDVPPNPTPLSDVEQALDMASQSSAVIQPIPFFVPQHQTEFTPTPVEIPAAVPDIYGLDRNTVSVQPAPPISTVGATPDLLQALGLPMFLVGQDIQALQTLASSPGLLNTMVDAHGMYDQTRLLSLVQTLSGTQNHKDPSHLYNLTTSLPGEYGMPVGQPLVSPYIPSPSYGSGSSGGPRSKSDDGNLHLAGYGPGTTQTDIITLFLPYVKVDEVVMKGTFAFVNTSDPAGAQRAKESLQGSLLNGMPIRINPATRKGRDGGSSSSFSQTASSAYGPGSHSAASPFGPGGKPPASPYGPNGGDAPSYSSGVSNSRLPPTTSQPHVQQQQQPAALENVDHVRDDRGNPATKNLFVAGYGPGTTELQIRETFSKHAIVIGVVLKGNFTFVNTSTRQEAVKARNALQGQSINGGVLRVNFAKETGRLGTSFDLTYNEKSGPNAAKGGPVGAGPGLGGGGPGAGRGGGGAPSYYGRGY